VPSIPPVTALPASAVLTAWLEAVWLGRAGPDDLAAAVRGDAPRHLVVDPHGKAFELHDLPRRLDGPASLALPVPGDPLGLGGPQELNHRAIDAGEAVLAGGLALVPELDARTVVWRAHAADTAPWVDERDTAIELRTVLAGVTRRLVDLDVASWQPEIPDLLMNLRHRPRPPLPPGTSPRRVETVERAVLCLEIVELARREEGGAVSAHEVRLRREALTELDHAARRALVGACSHQG
jgi:hypothetical protein